MGHHIVHDLAVSRQFVDAPMVRQLSCKQQVIGSSPIRGSTQKVVAPQRKLRCRYFLRSGAKQGFVSHSVGHFFRYRSVMFGGSERQVAHTHARMDRLLSVYCLPTVTI